MPDDRQRVRDDSDQLIAALDNLKSMELRKRGEDISTPPFHDLADRIADQSRAVFNIAADEARDGERVTTTDVSISEVAPSGASNMDATSEPGDVTEAEVDTSR